MATITGTMYVKALGNAFKKKIDFINDEIKVMLCTSSYTPNQDTHEFKSDITNEIEAEGYTAGGEILTGRNISYNATENTMTLDGADTVFGPATIPSARYAIIYNNEESLDSAKVLIGYIDFGENKSCSEGNLSILWNSDGILQANTP